MTDNASRFSAYKLRDIRIFLLWHHGRASAVRVIQFHEGKLTRTPEDDLLREAREVNHKDRGCREEFKDVIAVTDRIHAVHIDALEVQFFRDKRTIDRQGCARECAGTKRHDVCPRIDALKTLKIPRKHAKICHKMMREEDGLSTLQMRVPRHDNILICGCSLHKCLL